MSRTLALLLPIALIAAGLAMTTSPTEHGGRTLEGFWLAALGLALAPALAGRGAASRLTSVFLLGFAGQLAITQPHWLQYLRLHPREYDGWLQALAPAAIGLQAVIALRASSTTRSWNSRGS